MIGRLVTQLYDVLAEVRFDNHVALFLERVVEVNLLRRHALRFDDRADLVFLRDPENVVAGMIGIGGHMDLHAARLELRDEFREMLVEVIDRFPLDFGCRLPRFLQF